MVGFVFYENPVTNLHFVLCPGHEELADEVDPLKFARCTWKRFKKWVEVY